MYQLLLTYRYLTSKVMPLLASLAVMLCCTMVLVTWSVMGGFLKVLLESGRTLVGDVSIIWPGVGFAHYDDLIRRLEGEKGMVAAAAPVIETYGIMALPDGRTPTVVIKGIEPESYDRVTGFKSLLWWRPLERPMEKDTDRRDWRLRSDEDYDFARFLANGETMTRADPRGGGSRPAIVPGIESTNFNVRLPSGVYLPLHRTRRTSEGQNEAANVFLPMNGEVTLHVLPLDAGGRGVEMVSRIFPVANEFKSGLYQIDKSNVFVPLAELQRMLKMDAAKRMETPGGRPRVVRDPITGEERIELPRGELREDPARVTAVIVRGADGVRAEALKKHCQQVYERFAAAHGGRVPPGYAIEISTWEDQNATFIAAVRKETALVLFLFSMISFVAVFLVLAIFWSMVSEKTKDVGTLRAIGAARAGVASLWLSYGAAIGAVGVVLGGVASFLIVRNINPIHEWLGTALGISIWDPTVYYFTRIPSDLAPWKVIVVLGGGILSSVLGALAPALRAANMDPVRSLRFE